MKKKKIALFCPLLVCLCALLAFTACGSSTSAGSLTFGKKYINRNTINADDEYQTYYVFHSDGTGTYRHYSSNMGGTYDYTLHFKWLYTDSDESTVVWFYDSVEYGTGSKSVASTETGLVNVSENVLVTVITGGYSYFICEDYLPQIPNYAN